MINNTLETAAAIAPIEEFESLLEIAEDYELLQIATARMASIDSEICISMDDLMVRYGITQEELEEGIKTVEIE